MTKLEKLLQEVETRRSAAIQHYESALDSVEHAASEATSDIAVASACSARYQAGRIHELTAISKKIRYLLGLPETQADKVRRR